MAVVGEFQFVSVKDEDQNEGAFQDSLAHPAFEENLTDPVAVKEEVSLTHPRFAENLTDPVAVKKEELQFVSVKDEHQDEVSLQDSLTHPAVEENLTDPLAVKEEVSLTHSTFEENLTDLVAVKKEVFESAEIETHALGVVKSNPETKDKLPTGAISEIGQINPEMVSSGNPGATQQVQLESASNSSLIAGVTNNVARVDGSHQSAEAQSAYRVCEMCGEAFPNTVYLIDHLPVCQKRQVEKPEDKCACKVPGRKECSLCQKSLVQPALLLRQLLSSPAVPVTHVIGLNSTSACLLKKKPAAKEVETSKCKICDVAPCCALCRRNAHAKVGLYKHSVGNKTLFHHSKVQPCPKTRVKAYKCELCSSSFCQKMYLQCHRQKHAGKQPYKCGQCNRLFPKSLDLSAHKCLGPYTVKFKICVLCHENFPTHRDLAAHKLLHKEGTVVQCRLCGKWLSSVERKTHRCNAPIIVL